MRWIHAVPVLLLIVVSCVETATGPENHDDFWKVEELQPGMSIAFPGNYEGDGFWCGFDACYFEKTRTDHSVNFTFALGPMTGVDPVECDELPELLCYPHRELITTDSGLHGALYYAWTSENKCVKSVGTFLVEKNGEDGFHQVVSVLFADSRFAHVCEVLRTVAYAIE